jgi:hypothetical protein
VSHDNGTVASVNVNGRPAKILSTYAGVSDWEVRIDAISAADPNTITATASDIAGNTEHLPARVAYSNHG